ncbi:MAG: hypothetical protein RJB68_1918, partial [Pseudomonadota bacterium]
MTEWMVVAGVVLGLLQLVLLVLLLRSRTANDPQARTQELAQLEAQRQELLARLQSSSERVERELRREVQESARSGRQELAQNLAMFQKSLVQQAAEATRTQNTQIDAFGQQLA